MWMAYVGVVLVAVGFWGVGYLHGSRRGYGVGMREGWEHGYKGGRQHELLERSVPVKLPEQRAPGRSGTRWLGRYPS